MPDTRSGVNMDPALKNWMTQQFDKLTKSVNNVKKICEKQTKQIDGVDSKVSSLDSHTIILSIKTNQLEQRDRDLGCKVRNFKLTDNEKKDPFKTLAKVYKTLLVPCYTKAVSDGILDEIPPIYQVLEWGHYIPTKKSKSGEGDSTNDTVIIKFLSRYLKMLCFRYKKVVCEEYNTHDESEVYMHDDLTRANGSALYRIKKDPLVLEKSAYALGGVIKFRYKDTPLKIVTVLNPFANNIKDMCKLPKSTVRGYLFPLKHSEFEEGAGAGGSSRGVGENTKGGVEGVPDVNERDGEEGGVVG